MAYATVRSGSRGDDVRQLQQLLNQRGYGLDVDGIFGTHTPSAADSITRAFSVFATCSESMLDRTFDSGPQIKANTLAMPAHAMSIRYSP